MAYLTQVFDPATRAKAGRRRRLLIVDGHSSHVNMEFIRIYNRLKILLLILPPHSIHRLHIESDVTGRQLTNFSISARQLICHGIT
jgi:hypothetical protein